MEKQPFRKSRGLLALVQCLCEWLADTGGISLPI